VTAARAAVASPLLDVSINGAKGILYNITGSANMTLPEISEASNIINQATDPDANIIFGATIDDSMGDKIKISVIATGFENTSIEAYRRPSFGAYDRPNAEAQSANRSTTASSRASTSPNQSANAF